MRPLIYSQGPGFTHKVLDLLTNPLYLIVILAAPLQHFILVCHYICHYHQSWCPKVWQDLHHHHHHHHRFDGNLPVNAQDLQNYGLALIKKEDPSFKASSGWALRWSDNRWSWFFFDNDDAGSWHFNCQTQSNSFRAGSARDTKSSSTQTPTSPPSW